jgi:hypothetical protein
MHSAADETQFRNLLLTTRIIVAALAAGSLMFLVIVVVLSQSDAKAAPAQGALLPISLAALAMLVPTIGARLVVPGLIVAQGRRKIVAQARETLAGVKGGRAAERRQLETALRPQQFYPLFQARTIVAGALLEGATFFLLVAHMVERSPWTLAAAAALIVGILFHMPLTGRVAAWLDEQMRLAGNELDLQ